MKMKQFVSLFVVLFTLTGLNMTANAEGTSVFDNFITSSGDRIMDGDEEVRFISFNIPTLHYHEDYRPQKGRANRFLLPNEYEITDALKSIKQMGGEVVRIYALAVKKPNDDPETPRHILSPEDFDEESFRALDKMLQVANKLGIRIIIPFVNNWSYWGGTNEYAAFRGKKQNNIRDWKDPENAFWHDPQLIADFKKTLDYVINRKNYYTGIRYKDDKAIFAWETGNELVCPHSWTHEIAMHIKSLDRNHLLIDAFHTNVLRQESIDDPYIDIVNTHHYEGSAQKMIANIKTSIAMVNGKKPYFIGEFGFISTPEVRELLDTVIESNVFGILIWSLRYHNRDGGFFWHTENENYKSYHWPGFASGEAYDETNLLNLMREKAFEIRGLPVPPIEKPEPPFLLTIEDSAEISWQGSAGAGGYDVERAETRNGPWTVVGTDISDAAVQYQPLFNDASAEDGKQYYYRVKAKNSGGISAPSNVVGPVTKKE